MTAWAVAESDALAQDFACLLRKPFDVDVLLTCVATAIQTQLSPEEEQWAASVHDVFAAFGAGDTTTLERLCTADVRFVAPRHADMPLVLEGRTAYLAYAGARPDDLPGMRFVDVRVYGLPHGLAARYEMHWSGADGDELSESGATVFRFAADGRIRQIGVDCNPERHRQLAGVWSGGPDATEGVA
jgi:ketosteroid isomerase-like protein